ncbi:MAG: class I SAM-dependent methyltransferase [Pseudomonadota bacterium]|nr:class I SAM-dependent methyltransferase [Pseudomonadota bacterium]
MKPCLICSQDVEPFISFGRMPIANGFLEAGDFADEYFFELRAGFCERCRMVQLTELVDRERMFHDNYPFFSSTSTRMAIHFESFAHEVISRRIGGDDPFVVEIGSNDGIMLRHFASAGIRHLGIEPSANVAAAAQAKGIRTVCRFFDAELAREIVAEHGQADAFLGANVMCHIPYLHSVLEGIEILLKPSGHVLFEDPYLADIIAKTAYDQIYDEHAFYFSLASVQYLFSRHGMEVVDIQPQNVHGGSMRYVIARRGVHPVSAAVRFLADKEKAQGLDRRVTFNDFRVRVERSRDELLSLLRKIKKEGKSVAGYAATSKSTTVLNYCGITPELLPYICDTTPLKQGRFSPGMHIPIRPYEEFKNRFPDYALLFGWNHAEEIMAKEEAFVAGGGKWILYVPEVHIQ